MIWFTMWPDSVTYNTVVGASKRARQWQRAVSLMETMNLMTVEPDPISYRLALGACQVDPCTAYGIEGKLHYAITERTLEDLVQLVGQHCTRRTVLTMSDSVVF